MQFPRWQILGRYLSTAGVPDLNDVSKYWEHDPLVDGDPIVLLQPVKFDEKPSGDGEYTVEVDYTYIHIALNDKNGVSNLPFVDSLATGDYIEVETTNSTGFGSTHTAQVSSISKPGAYYTLRLEDDGVKPVITLAELITKVLYIGNWTANNVTIKKVRRVAENNSLLLYNSATEKWEVGGADLIGNFIKKDGDQIPEGAEHCWMGGDYPLLPSKMCLSYAKLDLSDSYALSDRAGIEVVVNKGGAERPFALSTSSSTGTVFNVFSYESGKPDDRGSRFKLDANGSIYSNGSLLLDLSSAATHPAAGLALRLDLDGVTRINYNSSNKELSLSESLLRLNFAAGLTSNPAEIKVGNDLITTYSKDGIITHKKRVDIDLGTVTDAGLRIVGSLAVKDSTNIEQKNSFYVGSDFCTVTARSKFNPS